MRAPYVHALKPELWTLKPSKDLGGASLGYYLGIQRPDRVYHGDRMIHRHYGQDTSEFLWRGQFSNAWVCMKFGYDFAWALEWLLQADDPENTSYYWIKEVE